MTKNAIYLAKNVIKNQTFFLSEKFIISLIRNLRLPFSNANSEAGMWDTNATQVLSEAGFYLAESNFNREIKNQDQEKRFEAGLHLC